MKRQQTRKHCSERNWNQQAGSFQLRFLLTVLNSRVARDFLRNNRRSNIHLYPDDWKSLPIPAIPLDEQVELTALVDRILTAKQAGEEATQQTLEAEIDQIVYRLFELTPEEITLIENSTPGKSNSAEAKS